MIESLLSYGWWVGAILIVIGFVALVKGADWLVDGASAIAKRFGVSDLIIGLTVVAFGTSMPEFVVNMVSVAEGSTDLAITNILGSNVINTFVILGLTALVYPIVARKQSFKTNMAFTISAGLLVLLFVFLPLPYETIKGINRIDGIILLLLFIYFLYNSFRHAKSNPEETSEEEIKPLPAWKAVICILVGLLGLTIGGELIDKSAVNIAVRMGVSEAIIGLTIVALGTSLPELATSVIAAAKHNSDIALGNVVGSNIFNVFFVLSVSATIRPLPAYQGIELDAFMAALGSILVWLFVITNKQRAIQRWEGALLLLVYAGYLTYRLLNI